MFQYLKAFLGWGQTPESEGAGQPPHLRPRSGPPPIPGNRPSPAMNHGYGVPNMGHRPADAQTTGAGAPVGIAQGGGAGYYPPNGPNWPVYWNPGPSNIHPSHVPAYMPANFHPHPYFPPPPQFHQAYPPTYPPTYPIGDVKIGPAPPSQAPVLAPATGVKTDSPSYQWPDGDVKLECTFGQEPTGWSDEGWKWRSSGARKTGVPQSATHVDKQICLGVFHCGCLDASGAPSRFFRPKSATRARNKQLLETCHICRATLVHVTCDATLTYYRLLDDEETLKAIRHHVGRHNHRRPPLTKLSASEVEALDLQVRQNPESTAQQLRAGAGATQVSLSEINPILLNARKARHEVEKSKVRQDLIPAAVRNSGFQLIESLSALKTSFETPWIVEAELHDRQFICMQTPFMRDVLLRDSVQSWHNENLEAESGRHGLITDGTHNFFKQGILLTSLAFSPVLFRWVVVLYTWIGNQDAAHHVPHFKQLVHVIAELCTHGLGFTFDERLFSAILDFSNAQRNGFVEAFVSYMCSRIPGWSELSSQSQTSERASLRLRALALLLGCKVHWRRSTHKIKQVIGMQFQFRFEALIAVLEGSGTTSEQFLQAVADIHREFPEVRPWLSWWILPGNGGMIFPAMQRMPAELRAKLPSSTNGGESAHNLLYGAAGRNHDIWEGVRRLYRVQRETELLYDAVLAGHVQPRFQGAKPQPASKVTWLENDGRAPDTRARLEAVAALEADLVAQKANLTEAERFSAINSAFNSTQDTAAETNHRRSLDRRMLQSYKWEANSCFIDASMEALFRAFAAMSDGVRANLLRHVRTGAPNTGLRDVFEHFYLRGLLSGAIVVENPAKHETPAVLFKKLVTALDAAAAFNLIQQTDTTPRIQQFFASRYKLKFICASNHVFETIHRDLAFETLIRRRNLAVSQAYIEAGSPNPSLASLLLHWIPEEQCGTRGQPAQYIHHADASVACTYESCSNQASLTSISTEWPLILRVYPQLSRVSGDIPLKDVSCPVNLHIGPEVEYELISRVIYSGSAAPGAVGHYTTQVKLGTTAYIYNDLVRDGALAELGPLSVLEEINPNTTTRAIAEIEADCAKVLPRPRSTSVSSSNPDELPVAPPSNTDDVISNMILGTLLGDDPAAQQEDMMDSPAKSDSTNSTTPCPIFCLGCGMISDGDDGPDQVQCETCKFWSHMECLPQTSDVDWEDPEVEFICSRCAPRPTDQPDLFEPNEIVMLPHPLAKDWTAAEVLWYPAIFVQRYERSIGTVREFRFKWLNCDWVKDHPDLPLMIPQTYQNSRDFLLGIANVVLKGQQIGKICLPVSEKSDFPYQDLTEPDRNIRTYSA
ncbi:hypothetical protein C8R46DRAFT_1327960 [Mycena filopes]|nr:hypothetical protein C8R46DRAFT_1327960 [Mycena filopes]